MQKDESMNYLESYDPTPILFIHGSSAIAGTLIGTIMFFGEGVELIKVIFAPRVYLIENLMNLL